MKNSWRKYLPNIYLKIVLPLIRIETSCMYERLETRGIEWTGIYINIWKYSFNFNWYWKPI